MLLTFHYTLPTPPQVKVEVEVEVKVWFILTYIPYILGILE